MSTGTLMPAHTLTLTLERPDNGPHTVVHHNINYSLTSDNIRVVEPDGTEHLYQQVYVVGEDVFVDHAGTADDPEYVIESTYTVGSSTVRICLFSGGGRYHVYLDEEDPYDVWHDEDTDGWYTRVGYEAEGPWVTSQELFDEMFLTA